MLRPSGRPESIGPQYYRVADLEFDKGGLLRPVRLRAANFFFEKPRLLLA